MPHYHATFSTPLGQMSVSACDNQLVSSLFAKNYPDEGFHGSNKVSLMRSTNSSFFEQVELKLQNYFNGLADITNAFLLSPSGTPFQHRVWAAIALVPAGRTTSYSEIAIQISQALANRAVANACAKNHLALFIPCHRITNAQNKTTGYHWGIKRALYLLELEKYYWQREI